MIKNLDSISNKTKEQIFLDRFKTFPHLCLEQMFGLISYMDEKDRDAMIYSLELQLFMLKEGILDHDEVKE